MAKLKDKVAVVTGASKGIGAGIAKALAAEGASVVVNYASSKADAERVVSEIAKAGGKAVAVQGNVAKSADVEKLFAETKKAFGRLDVLVNNAGVYAFSPLEQVTEESFNNQFGVNVLGVLLATREALKYFGSDGGSVVNISSAVTDITPPNASVYVGTKAAIDGITGSLAKELGPRKIRVNAINPGMIETEGVHAAGFIGSDFQKGVETQTALGRIGQTDDIAPTAVYLASSDSKYMTGETLHVAGGL